MIEEGVVARFINRQAGIYELDWQDVVWKYWFEFRAARKDPKRSKNVKFNHRTASNNLRAALLNSYKDKGAEEYPERKVMDRKNKTIKRSFRMPSTVIEKLSNCTGPDVSLSNNVSWCSVIYTSEGIYLVLKSINFHPIYFRSLVYMNN